MASQRPEDAIYFDPSSALDIIAHFIHVHILGFWASRRFLLLVSQLISR
jgi:hypothetical protein